MADIFASLRNPTEQQKLEELAMRLGISKAPVEQPVNLDAPPGASVATGETVPPNVPEIEPVVAPPQRGLASQLEQAAMQQRAAVAPYLEKQEAQLKELEARIREAQEAPRRINFAPLLALHDSNFGTKLSESYKAPESAAERARKNVDLQKVLLQGQEDLTGKKLQEINNKLMNSTLLAQNRFSHQDSQLDDRNAFRAHKDIVDTIKKDPQLKAQLGQLRNLDNATAIVIKSDKLTPQQIDEFQQAIRSNLGIKGQSGVGERERTFLNSMGLNAERWMQFLSGNPAEIAQNNEIVKHIKDLAEVESQNVKTQINDRLSTVAGGFESMYEDPRYAGYKSDLGRLIDSFGKQTKTQALGQTAGPAAQQKPETYTPKSGPMAGKVLRLNKNTGLYE